MKKETILRFKYHDFIQQLIYNILMLQKEKPLQPQEDKEKSSPKYFSELTCSLFPHIFSLSDCQNNELSQQIFNTILTWFNDPKENSQLNQSIIHSKDLSFIKKKIQNLQCHEYIFYCDYGCIVDFFRQEKFSLTELNLIFPKQWDFGNIIKEGGYKYIPCDPHSSTHLFIGTIKFGSYSLKQEKQHFRQILDILVHNRIEQKNNVSKQIKKKNHHTPTWLLQVAKQSCRKINNGEAVQADKKQEKQKTEQFQAISKGGTLDVGPYVGSIKPNTSFQLAKYYMQFLIQDKKLINLMMVDFKLYYIVSIIIQLKKISIYQDKKYRQCLLTLIKQIQQLTNEEIYYLQQITNIKIEKAYHFINNFFLKKEGQIITIQQLNKAVHRSLHVNEDYHHTFYSITNYDIECLQQKKDKGFLGFSSPLKIIKDFKSLQSNKYDEYLWVLMVEQFFFDIAIERLGPTNIPININLSEIKCKDTNDFSIMHSVINKYESIMSDKNKQKIYGLMLQNQSYAHLYLIKYIGSAIAFEVIKKQRGKNESNLEMYRIPQDIQKLYTMFHSLSYKARLAIKAMIQYSFRNKAKSPIFSLDGINKSFYKYANLVSNEDNDIKTWKLNQQQLLMRKISNLADQFLSFKKKYEGFKKEKTMVQNRSCLCQHKWVDYYYRKKYELIKCKRCQALEEINSKIQSSQREKGKNIISSYAEHEINLYGFIRCTPLDILGMMKIIYESQIQKFTSQESSINRNFFYKQSHHYDPMTPFAQQVKGGQFSLYINYQSSPQSFVKYPSKITNYYYRYISQKVQISQKLLLQDKLINHDFEQRYQFMMNSPNIENSKRQHENYSNLYYKVKQENIEDFIAFSNVRVSQQTQLMILSQKIKNRTLYVKDLISSSQIAHDKDNKQLGIYAKILIVLKSVADINALNKLNQETSEFIHIPIIYQCILDLLQMYQKKWKYEDLYFLHTVGAIFSLLSVEMNKPELSVRLAYRAYQQSEKYVKQMGVGDNNIKSQISYFLHGMLSCYTEDITKNMDNNSVQTFAKLIILFKINKVFSDQNVKDTRYRETMVFWDHFRQRAIFKNVDNVKNYFINNLSQITKIVQIVDKDVPPDIQWRHNTEKGQYVFTGECDKKQYNLNLFTGILLKNNCQLAGLSQKIKQNIKYIAIFGKDRDLQIYPQSDGSQRTRTDFSEFFPNQQNTKILFQFKVLGNDVIIRMIIKRDKKKQLKYVLVSKEILEDSNFIIPIIYRQQYFAWYCEAENHIVFREKELKRISNIGLILLVTRKKSLLFVKEGRIVENKFKKQPLEMLKEKQNADLFDQITFFPTRQEGKDQFKFVNKAFYMLSSIEFSDYIIQILSTNGRDKERKIKFLLHRYNLKFTLCPEKGLLSDNYQGYAVCQQYNSHQLLPWGTFQKVKCLVLGKIQNNLRFAKNHEKIILIPDTLIILDSSKSKRNQIKKGQTQIMKMFCYQIHDLYKDLRSKTKLQQLHLACIIASCHFSMFQPLMMTNVQYTIKIMKSCLQPVPLSSRQLSKLQNILRNSIQLNQTSLILLSQAIYEASNSLKYILPYNLGRIQRMPQKRQTLFDQRQQYIVNCKDKYLFNLQKQTVPIRQELSELELKILNLSKAINLINKKQQQQSKWKLKNKINLEFINNIQQSIVNWKEQINYYYQNIKRIIAAQIKQIDSGSNNKSSRQEILSLNFDNNDTMSRQKYKQIYTSINSYLTIKQKIDKIVLSNMQKQTYISEINDQIIKINKTREDILKSIDLMQENNKNHYDFLSRRRTFIKQRDFTEILCNRDCLKTLYPDIKRQQASIFKQLIKLWIQFSTYLGSLQRIILILQDKQNLEKENLLREIESPREQIVKIIPWICFELEMKSQIWLSQFQTFKLLQENTSGSVTQLNMGEGKTQIIIPMLVLHEIYITRRHIPRVNILSPLYKEAQSNYFKFFSITGFRINIFPIYFNRTVQITDTTIRNLQNVMNLFQKNSLILIDRDSSLSMVLKLREQMLGRNNIYQFQGLDNINCNQKDKWIFRNSAILDIFDEVDALMTAKKSFVYAIGGSSALPDSRIRFQFNRLLMQIVIKQMLDFLLQNQMIVIQQSLQFSKEAIKNGKFPKGLRLLTKISQEKILQFRKNLVTILLDNHLPPEFQFYRQLNSIQKSDLIKYLIDSSATPYETIQCHDNIPQKVYNQIYAVRGIVAYGVLQHCLTLRCGVDYGVPNQKNPKRVGVPYEAADMPSQRSQYSHPEVATILSYFSYFNQGLKQKQFNEAIRTLLILSQSSQIKNYKLWLDCIESEDKKPKLVREPKQINQQSTTQKKQLYDIFKFCRNTIVFWLVHCVFPDNLAQYKTSITASSWDIADSVNSLGFSGTKDTHLTLPTYIKLVKSQNNQINGTDGKMINLMIQHTLDVIQIVQNADDLWKKFVDTALTKKIGCIIDAGAILAGKSLQNIIVPWISHLQSFSKLSYRGISYCDESGHWKVYDTSSHTTIDRETSIPEHQTFVIFDEARTRGADMKMKSDTKAALSLGPNMTKDKLMQAVGRLRKFGRNQQIYILSTTQNYSKIEGFNLKDSTKLKTKKVIEWVCINSINDNKKMLYPNLKLAWIHFKNVNSNNGIIPQQFNPQLVEMYKQPIKYEQVSILNQQMANSFLKYHKQNQFATDLVHSVRTYGQNFKVRCQNLEDICERQTQMVQQTVKENEKQFALLKPIEESKNVQRYLDNISTVNFELNDRLFFSKNFKECTYYGKQKNNQNNNQLCQIHFVLIKPKENQFMVITQRQANLKILMGTQCLGPQSIHLIKQKQFIVRFSDIKKDLPFIKQNSFEKALTDAQFFNGNENFQDCQLLYNTVKTNSKIFKDIDLQCLICHFVDRRRTKENKFYSSDLETVLKKIINSK